MGAERVRQSLVFGLILACLVASTDAQGGGKNGGKKKPRKPRQDPAQAPPLPGLPPGPKAPPKKPAGAKPPAQAVPKPSAPPLQEADLVTAGADLQATRELEQSRVLRAHFQICDLDANGWISLREAEVLLSFDREEYRRFDADQDGRIVPREFVEHQEELLARLGATPQEPEPAAAELGPQDPGSLEPGPVEPPPGAKLRAKSELQTMFPRPSDLLARYDANASSGLDAAELEKLCAEVGLELSPELIAAQMDPDESGQLEITELVPLAWIASRNLPGALRPAAPGLAGAASLTGESPVETPAPELLARTHFGLLDPSRDGAIDESDLRLLQSPARLDVRLETVFSALDRDGDGRLSEDEFRTSMSDAPGPAGGSN